MAIENRWIAQKEDLIANAQVQTSVQAIQNLGKDIVATYKRENAATPNMLLRFVTCGTIELAVTRGDV